MNFPSKLIEDAVNEISKLPGIGKKTALRLSLHLLKQDQSFATSLAQAIIDLRTRTTYCTVCHNLSDTPVCSICSSPKRDHSVICVVEDIPDVLAIENTAQYTGLYHVLGGVISPMQGIGPDNLHLDSLLRRTEVDSNKEPVREIILALPATMEGDTTAFYLSRKLKPTGVKITTIARGVPVGGELEFTDEITLGRSILTRTNYSTE
ncbi:Recombination protein RecR [Lunatimonas lonarensis]|uniref:Recombination protein RecR n=1 Tax=Lunatimonas lonarensis TaxID=1232681 RepID=R7ZP73_9BACT|nr:recombination mediator RecR [Lunatimonas lonarensis]EON75900.1 Recombination protein RecR [Lunatimonas lonarensis]